MRQLLYVGLLAGGLLLWPAMEGQAAGPVSTFSVCGFDPATGDLGVAVQSKFFGVGSVVPWVKADVGAIATQSYANVTYGPRGLELLEDHGPEEVIRALTASDPGAEKRQVGVVDRFGRSAAFTGEECNGWAGHLAGKDFVVQGNLLAGEQVVVKMAEAFEQAKEEPDSELADWLMAALTAGQAAGGDRRGQQSAALMVVRAGGGYGDMNDRYIDLRVEDDPEPIGELSRLLELHKRFFSRAHRKKPVREVEPPPVKEEEVVREESAPVSFSKEVAPVLAAECLGCHDPEKAKGGFRVDSYAELMKAGDSGQDPVKGGDAAGSWLYQLITTADAEERMPQKDEPLSAEVIETMRRWLDEGAAFDGADPEQPLVELVPRLPYPDPPARYARALPVTALAYHPDGKHLAVSGYREALVFEAATGKLVQRMQNAPEQMLDLAWVKPASGGNGDKDEARKGQGGGGTGAEAENGGEVKLLAAAGDPGRKGEVLGWGREGNGPTVLATAAEVFLCLDISEARGELAVGGGDHSIRVIDLEKGSERLRIQQHADWVTDVAFSPDDEWLASASRDRSARVYRVEDGGLEASYSGHGGPVYAVCWVKGSELVASAGMDRSIHVWRAKDGTRTAELKGIRPPLLSLARSGNQLGAAGGAGKVYLFDLDQRKLKEELAGVEDQINALAWMPGDGGIVAGSHGGSVWFWEGEVKRAREWKARPGGE